MSMQPVELKNGASEAEDVVGVAIMSIERLMRTNPIAFYELVMKCRVPAHQFFGNTRQVLMDFALVSLNGDVHDSLRNVVLSSVSGDGLNMKLGSPFKSAK